MDEKREIKILYSCHFASVCYLQNSHTWWQSRSSQAWPRWAIDHLSHGYLVGNLFHFLLQVSSVGPGKNELTLLTESFTDMQGIKRLRSQFVSNLNNPGNSLLCYIFVIIIFLVYFYNISWFSQCPTKFKIKYKTILSIWPKLSLSQCLTKFYFYFYQKSILFCCTTIIPIESIKKHSSILSFVLFKWKSKSG